MTGRGSGEDEGDVLLEFLRLGATVKVTAIDPKSLVEVSIVGPSSAGEAALRRVAIDKLRYVLGRREKQ